MSNPLQTRSFVGQYKALPGGPEATRAKLADIATRITHNGNIEVTYDPEQQHYRIGYRYTTTEPGGSVSRLEGKRLESAFTHARDHLTNLKFTTSILHSELGNHSLPATIDEHTAAAICGLSDDKLATIIQKPSYVSSANR